MNASDEFTVLEDQAGVKSEELAQTITNEEFAKLRAGNHRYEDEGKIFHMAVIDYLQEYNLLKSCERACVPVISGAKQETISVAKPHFYGTRFYSFLDRTFFNSAD